MQGENRAFAFTWLPICSFADYHQINRSCRFKWSMQRDQNNPDKERLSGGCTNCVGLAALELPSDPQKMSFQYSKAEA